MEEAAAVRRAAEEAVCDVVPDGLRAELEGFVSGGSQVPGVLTLLSARAAASDAPSFDELAGRAAGVQLVYDGLRLTRRLAHDEPWADGDGDADLAILAADVLVARGFYLLARTDAASAAVDVVRAFGRDQTERETAPDPAAVDRRLEADVLELAVVAGATAAGRRATPRLRSFADELAGSVNGQFPDSASLLSESARERLAQIAAPAEGSRALNRND